MRLLNTYWMKMPQRNSHLEALSLMRASKGMEARKLSAKAVSQCPSQPAYSILTRQYRTRQLQLRLQRVHSKILKRKLKPKQLIFKHCLKKHRQSRKTSRQSRKKKVNYRHRYNQYRLRMMPSKLSSLSYLTNSKSKLTTQIFKIIQVYVNDNEFKLQEEEQKMKQGQDLVLAEMRSSIQELEQLSQGLQQEVQQKDELYALLKNDFNRQEMKLQDALKSQFHGGKGDHLHVKQLEEEIAYLKKNSEIEVALLKDENDIMKKELMELQQRRRRDHMSSFTPNSNFHGNNYCSPIRPQGMIEFEDQSNEKLIPMYKGTQDNTLNNSVLLSPFPGQQNGNRNQPMQNLNQARTNDRFKGELMDKDRLIEAKNKEIIALTLQLEEIISNQNKIMNSQEIESIRRSILAELSELLYRLKKELQRARNTLTDTFAVQRNDNNMPNYNLVQVTEEVFLNELHTKLNDVDEATTLATEIVLLVTNDNERVNHHASRERTPNSRSHSTGKVMMETPMRSNNKPKNAQDSNYQVKRTADNYFKLGQTNNLYEMLLQQISKSESLMQDNAILQRTIYKYEQTLGDLDGVLRNGHQSNDKVAELKHIAEKQLKEIVMLQKEIEIVKYNSNQPVMHQGGSFNNTKRKLQNMELDNQIWSQTEDSFKSPKRAHNKILKSYQIENEELMNERQTLLQLCGDLEGQIKDSHRSLEESLEKIISLEKEVEDKEKEIEMIRTKITRVAELYERKEIQQRYSFEVLCDFIYDKAKRMFSKYDNLQNQVKQTNPVERKRQDRSELELEDLRQVLQRNNMLANELTQKFIGLIGEQQPQLYSQFDKEEGVDKFKQIACKVEVSYIQIKQENIHLKERINDLIKQLEFFQQNSDFSYKDKDRRKYELREDQARRELEHVRQEKEKLVDKNSELAMALKQAHDEIKQYREETDKLREKVNFYEKTFPLTLTRHKRQFMVPPLHISSEPTHHERQSTPDTQTSNTGKQKRELKDYQEILHDFRKDTDKCSEKGLQIQNMRSKLMQGSLHTSIGGSKKELTEVESGKQIIHSETGKMSLKMQGMLNRLGSDSSDCTDEDDHLTGGRDSKAKNTGDRESYDQRGSIHHSNEGYY